MKKLALALVCLVSVAFFASCDPEETIAPTVTPITDAGYVHDGMVLEMGESYPIGFNCHGTASDLVNLCITVNEEIWVDTTISGKDFQFNGSISFAENDSREIVGDAVIKATVKDALNVTGTSVMTVSINKEEALATTPFEWRRDGGAAGTGLAEFGLEWTSNTSTNAIIKPMEGAALYRFDNTEVWENTTTEAQKAALFSDLQFGIAQFDDVSVTAQEKDYDIVLGTVYNGEAHLIHVTHSTANQRSWHFVITGEAK